MPEEKKEEIFQSTSASSFEYPDTILDPVPDLGWLFAGRVLCVLLRSLQVLQGPWDSHMKTAQSCQTECVVAVPWLLPGCCSSRFFLFPHLHPFLSHSRDKRLLWLSCVRCTGVSCF